MKRTTRVAVIFDNKHRPETTGTYCLRALQQLTDVQFFTPDQLDRIPHKEFDLYLNIDDGHRYRLPAELRPSAWWAIDTHLDLEWCRAKAMDFDLVFTAQRDGAEQLRQKGIRDVEWLPLACDPEIHRPHQVAKNWDVSFVGNLFPGERAQLLELLHKRYPRSFVGQRYFEEMARTYSESRTVFNRSIRNDVNMRVFEAVACGSLLLTNDLRDNGQEELFREGMHLATYRSPEELFDKIAFYLGHDAIREKVAAAGQAEAHGRHSYRLRMQAILAALERFTSPKTAPVVATRSPGSENKASSPVPAAHELHGESRDPGYFQFARPELLERIPLTARRVLDIGCAGGRLGESLKARQPAHVTGVEMTESAARFARQRLDEVVVGNVEDMDFTAGSFDTVICGDVLEHLRDPASVLRRARTWLKPNGAFVTSIPNVRHHSVVCGLLQGNWTYEPAGLLDRDHLRFFTRREIDKLLFRTGFDIRTWGIVPGPGYDEWARKGRPGEVALQGLRIADLPPEEAEEFYVYQYLLTATPAALPSPSLTSIVILTHNQIEYTRLCVESIQRYTDEPYELVFVDNASTDGTLDYLDSLMGGRVIRNSENRGFPAAANQGIRAALGEQVLLLNNDTIVTTGWLQRLLRALRSAPDIGLAGPCSNFVGSEQQIPAAYNDLSGLDGFAWSWGKQNDAIRIDTDRLIGFCMLIDRNVIDRIGLLDEQFGIGCFEDDDYTRRALAAGFRAAIARDAFVHHFGGRTFTGMGVDFAAVMRNNQELFQKKWAKPASRPKSAPTPGPLDVSSPSPISIDPPPSHRMFRIERGDSPGLRLVRQAPSLSLCMICRDNAKTIEAALTSIKPFVDEMIVVDTGSKDDTAAIAEQLGAQVFHFPWPDSFSVARNESIRHARGEWIIWMDSDDTISPENGRKLRALVEGAHDPKMLGYIMQVHCPSAGPTGMLHVTAVDHLKLFRNRPDLRFSGRIHEQMLPAIRQAGGEVTWTDIFVLHSGYDHSPAGQERKIKRDLHLLNLELAEQPTHPFTLFNLGMTYADIGRLPEAIDFLKRSIQHSAPGDSHLRKAYALLVSTLHRHAGPPPALEICIGALRLFPNDLELRFRKAILLHESGLRHEAVAAYLDLLAHPDERHFTSVDRGMGTFKARQNLAVIFGELGDWPAAEEQWRQVVAEVPAYAPGWRGWSDCALRRQDLQSVNQLLSQMQAKEELRGEFHLLKSRLAAAQGLDAEARHEMQEALRAAPHDLDLLRLWCQFLFDRADWPGAQAALEDLARRDPLDGANHHNLGAVLVQRGAAEQAIQSYRESLRLRPNYPATLHQLGHACSAAGRIAEAREAFRQLLAVPYLALIAFLAECCRFAIRSAEVCYTGNSANHWPRIFTPHPAQGPISYPASTPPPLMPVES